MEPILPGNTRYGEGGNQTGELLINFDRTNDEVFIEIASEVFPRFTAERQLRVNGDVRDEVSAETGEFLNPAWIVQTTSGRLAVESFGGVIAISSYYQSGASGFVETFFAYEAVGICRQERNAA